MKNKTKIKILSVIVALLTVSLAGLIYLSFFKDSKLKAMGYTYEQIKLLHQYDLSDRVDHYHQSLLYALTSKDFDEKNIEYYLLLESEMDYTSIINQLAVKYDLQECQTLFQFLDIHDLISLNDYPKIENLNNFETLVLCGYTPFSALTLTNQVDDETLQLFTIELNQQKADNYISYLQTGYSPETINKLHTLSVDIFNDIAEINYFEQLDALISNSKFKINNLARYIWYMDQHDCDADRAVNDVNKNLDFIEDPDFESFYQREITIINEFSLTMLVNKNHQLKSDFVPEDLIDVDATYRQHSQPLYQEAAEAFVAMSDACLIDVDRRMMIYSGYRSYETEESLYQTIIAANTPEETESEQDETETVIVDSFASRAGASEHQTGLAIDVLQKGYSHQEFHECRSSSWMEKHAHEYGYILRYPKSRAFITGYYYISYHYRYVGVKPATIMKTYNWTLEEYNLLFN
ncbi:MAG: M15 family metallopeptidase [Bacillota bacterium]|jgi:D-alanyl-D-alanine carboxypeptidase|nr:M15 family metallopeptidase [Bacillota bacterium]NLL27157.1 M15 family metallopeptidase [Erysipelotrichia bacterium]